MENIKQYVQDNKERFINELIDLLKIPSVSADSAYSQDVIDTADAVKKSLENAGCDFVELCETPGYPIVYGEKIIDKNLPTVLVYGHYDVQPADPIELWDSPPFEPVIKKTDLHPEGAIFARGACDDKGQMYMHVKAFEYMIQNNCLPCNVKFMIEGEEEVGSKSLGWFVERNQNKLANDVILISDTGMISNQQPSITTGLRGLSYVEVEVTGPNRDLHSGLYGGAVANPINILTKMIASLHDENNHITIPGFYDKVEELSTEERTQMGKRPFSQEAYNKALDIAEEYGEVGYTTNERNSIRPTLDVNGIWGGYTGEGAKTVIASKAYAKISMRLVPNQDWENITELFQNHFECIAPKSVKVKVTPHHGGQGYVTPIDSIGYQAAAKAYNDSFGVEPIPVRSGGSIPIVALFEKELKSKTIMMGFGLDSDAIHSPNEHYGIFNYLKGIETIPLFYKYFTELSK
ncbi:dipeptidase [Flavobacterium columnare]|uniref:Peptidase dimerization domain-containing protein n=1 Tax=Flavobacterium columnare (strain ATCC 49512 / CIP 103533 / TG 44/87) TaxID=1041826 RepID=G8XAK4_FLACA|nr:dipeptidase [Flavobacterium columnare]AEW86675.1 peptidase dimerization domain-containing protein [Flavobacterium columnare ATCC 49512]ANO47086.1 peptidase dimerization domain-containing protein [Flavobacterium columnare]APT22225.1 peptidase dimerization domain protein [Flavobacterium columnare]MBF6653201.1 dipeptidase [Flavobacterium columnare]MBF6656702.1 dipeptidase [Flavobacterium columnare]